MKDPVNPNNSPGQVCARDFSGEAGGVVWLLFGHSMQEKSSISKKWQVKLLCPYDNRTGKSPKTQKLSEALEEFNHLEELLDAMLESS
ncbi:hypothetical protein Bca4012_056476 [Brassica carinata]|uniref:Uncharacterized protein n=1 Tax=Brassica carinata TaxID=52824 RepID=A0A8X7W0V5_BRACI|nr:hypothetical protein Bca52824_013693 [Brassica carinata]